MQCPHVNDQYVTFSVQGKLIYKDQCTKCFVEAKSENGLDVCLKCFNGGCVGSKFNHSQEHFAKHNHPLILRLKVTELPPETQKQEEITKLAIGKQGGFNLEGPDFKVESLIYCYLCKHEVQDEKLNGLVQSIKNSESAYKKNALAQWEMEIQPCEHTLTMEQIPKKNIANVDLAKCNDCDLSNNLWLCLSCGNLGCGRKNYDGSGGNNHGIEHFNQTKHPLVVKLGTITPEGSASVHCYACGDEVADNYLKDHLANFGIDVGQQKKTEKSIAELTLDANLALQLSKVIEEGRVLTPAFGPSFTGIDNLGNSCYMNSVVQVLFQIPEIVDKYYQTALQHQAQCYKFPMNCYYCQMAKVAYGIHSGDFCQKKVDQPIVKIENQQQEEEQYYQDGIRLYDLKQLIAQGNNEFLSQRQQDSFEYLSLLFRFLQKGEKQENIESTISLFEHQQVTILKCTGCGSCKVNPYKTTDFKVPVEHPTPEQIKQWNEKKEQEAKRLEAEGRKPPVNEELPEYPTTFKRSLDLLKEGDVVSDQLYCPNCQSKQMFVSNVYFRTFPQYLIVPVNRFVMGSNWVPKKLNAMIHIDEVVDFEEFKEPIIHPDKIMKDKPQQQEKKYSEDNIAQLTAMGFTPNAAKRSLLESNDNVEVAAMWLMERMDDPTINEPIIEAPENQMQEESVFITPDFIYQIMDMGFTEEQARLALRKTDNNIERAMDFIFNHDMEEEMTLDKQQEKAENKGQPVQDPGSSKYSLYAVIVHLGRSTHCGHYVAYIKKDGQWVLYNDSKVALTPDPVLGKGYIYIFQRL